MNFYSNYNGPEDILLFCEELDTLEARCTEYLPTDAARITTRLENGGDEDTDFVETLVDCFHIVRHGEVPSLGHGIPYREEFIRIATKVGWTSPEGFPMRVAEADFDARRNHRPIEPDNTTDPKKVRLSTRWMACVRIAFRWRRSYQGNPHRFGSTFARNVLPFIVNEVAAKMTEGFISILARETEERRGDALGKYWARYGKCHPEEDYSFRSGRERTYAKMLRAHRYRASRWHW